jgi:hypothetical protein
MAVALTSFINDRLVLDTLRHTTKVQSVDGIAHEFLAWRKTADQQSD